MYISEKLIKEFLVNEIEENTLWLINTSKAEKRISIKLGSNQFKRKRRPFVVLKLNKNSGNVCVAFFSSQQFYKNQVSFCLKSNCEKKCDFRFFDVSYVYGSLKKNVFSISKNYFDFDIVEYCGICKNMDYLAAKLKEQVENCK